MLNPISRVAFMIGAIVLLFAFRAWLKVHDANDERTPRLVRRAAMPTAGAMFAFAIGIFAMALWGPWARPYQYDPVLEAPFQPSDD